MNFFKISLFFTALVSTAATAQVLPDNPANPFDYIGAKHNETLDFIIENKDELGEFGPAWNLQGTRLAVKYICADPSVGGGIDAGCGTCLPMDALTLVGRTQCLADLTRAEFLETIDLSFEQSQALSAVYSAIDKMGDLPPDSERNADELRARAQSVINSIKSVEAATLRTLRRDEAQVVLIAASIARHSTAYWTEASLDSASLWANPPGGGPGSMGPLSLLDVIEADARGGSVPADPIIMLGGAAVGSFYNILGQIWNWLF
ncbi:MAG: hypothetical protein AAF533_05570 [Acidobacteriota bacterium]